MEICNSTISSRMATADLEPVTLKSRVAWFEEHSPSSRPLWVCEDRGRITAWLSFSAFYGRPAYSRTAEISVYVHEAYRRHGLATYLMTKAIAHAPGIKVETLLGFIFGHKAPSLALF